MEAVFREAVRVLERGEPCVLATVVQTLGSTPQKPGAKLLVRKDGSGVGTLGGGCVEGDIWFLAKVLLREGGPPEVREYHLNEDLAARDGLVCGGTMRFLIDPIYEPASFLPIARAVVRAYEGGDPVAVASVLRAPQGSGLRVGQKVLVRADGSTEGDLGDPALTARVVESAREAMPRGETRHLDLGEVEVFVEGYTTPPTLVLMGGGHIGKALARMGRMLGFRIYVVDDRPEFANPERFPEAEATLVADYAEGLRQVPVNANTAVIIATRGHRYDDMATEAAVRSPAGYVGLVGSKRKSVLILEDLYRKGIPDERIRQIRAPVGLDIGARTPEEIALSILAEVVMWRNGGSGGPMQMSARLFETARRKALEGARTPTV